MGVHLTNDVSLCLYFVCLASKFLQSRSLDTSSSILPDPPSSVAFVFKA